MGKAIHRELYKNLKFDHTKKRYMHNPESALEQETLKTPGILRYKRITKSRLDD